MTYVCTSYVHDMRSSLWTRVSSLCLSGFPNDVTDISVVAAVEATEVPNIVLQMAAAKSPDTSKNHENAEDPV